VARISVSLTVGAAVFLVGAGLVIWLLARRKGDRGTGPVLLVGFPGLYLSLLASIGAPRWLYIPAGVLVASAYLMQLVAWPRRQAKSGAAAQDANGRGVTGE
jgi:hypothetical protein